MWAQTSLLQIGKNGVFRPSGKWFSCPFNCPGTFRDRAIQCGQSLKRFFWIPFMVANLCLAFLGNSLKSFRTNLIWNKEASHAGGEYLILVRNKTNKSRNESGFSSPRFLSSFSSWAWAMCSINVQGRSDERASIQQVHCEVYHNTETHWRERGRTTVERTSVLKSGQPGFQSWPSIVWL